MFNLPPHQKAPSVKTGIGKETPGVGRKATSVNLWCGGLPEKIVIYDTEYTSWEGAQARNWNGPNEFKEIVQIGALLIGTKTLEILDTKVIFVRPKKNPVLSEYFIELTGISQEDVETRGIDFPAAIQEFALWTDALPMYSFGTDALVMEENCKLHDIPFPFTREQFHDVRKIFQDHGIATENYTSGIIVRAFDRPITRRPHNALNDVKTILDGLRLLANA